MVNGTRKNIGIASVKGDNRAVANARLRRKINARAKLNDPTSRISQAKKSIRKGTVNLNRVFDPNSNAERF